MSVTGKWEGKILDAAGPTARVMANLRHSQGRVTGDFAVYVESARGGECCGGDWRLAHTAPVTGTYNARTGSVRLKYRLSLSGEPTDVAFRAGMRKADPHARKAMVGDYAVSDQGHQIGLEGGCCILWQYKN